MAHFETVSCLMHPYEELHKFDESQIHNPLGKDVWHQNGVCPDSVSATRPLSKQKLCGIFFVENELILSLSQRQRPFEHRPNIIIRGFH